MLPVHLWEPPKAWCPKGPNLLTRHAAVLAASSWLLLEAWCPRYWVPGYQEKV